uniref:G_PROTEIN_RECEP_F1_2 domain-containing protein n=1 Tax=Rhabditophanes sp. KR3021 TaxID=114890 RepID=A0AC35TZ60_9BILA
MIYFSIDTYNRFYNCNALTDEEWDAEGMPNIPLGIAYIFVGFVFIFLYVLSMTVIFKKEYTKNPAYFVMCYLSVIDLLGILFTCTLTGFLTIEGSVFCTFRLFNFLSGSFAMMIWAQSCMTSILLIVNRTIDIYKPSLASALFEGYKVKIWLLVPTLYGLMFLLFTPPLAFTAKQYSYYFDPYIMTKFDTFMSERNIYESVFHPINNIIVIVCMSTFYFLLYLIIFLKHRGNSSDPGMSRIQTRLFYQSLLICTPSLITCSCYLYIEVFPPVMPLIVFLQFSRDICHAIPAISYVCFNKTIRNEIIGRFFPSSFQRFIRSKSKVEDRHIKQSCSNTFLKRTPTQT